MTKAKAPFAKGALMVCFLSLYAPTLLAQAYPTKSIRLIVGTSAGGGGDVIGRIVAGGLNQIWGQQVIVDNRPGAGGNIAPETVAKAPPDGYTLWGIVMADTLNANLYKNLTFNVLRDFEPVTQMATGPQVVVVHPTLPVKSMAELVSMAKAKPGTINYASAGTGTSTYLAAEMFKSQAGINLVHVPYKGGGASLASIVGGETAVFFGPVAVTLPHIRTGRLRALAVTSAKRLPLLPELPTVADTGYPGYEASNWYGLMAPAKTPAPIIKTIRDATVSVLNRPDINKSLVDLGYIIIGDEPKVFGAYVKGQVEKFAKVVKTLGLTAEGAN